MSGADPWWERLVEVLGAHGTVSEPGPGRIRVEIGGQAAEIVMTPSDWDSWAGTVNGAVEHTAEQVVAHVRGAIREDSSYLVFQTYDLHPSDVPELPDQFEEMDRRIDEARRANPDATFGWYAHKPERDEFP